jgi:hypothetical protein
MFSISSSSSSFAGSAANAGAVNFQPAQLTAYFSILAEPTPRVEFSKGIYRIML